MTGTLLIYPMFAMVLLTIYVLVRLFRARVKAVAGGIMEPWFYKTYQGDAEPDELIKLSRHFQNIFEAPTLFYIACLAALVTGTTGLPYLILAWVYVLARVIHAHVHTGTNKLRHRINIYFFSWIVLFAMWILIVARVSFPAESDL